MPTQIKWNQIKPNTIPLDSLSDVVITSPSIGQVLKWNGTNWVNDTDATWGGWGGGWWITQWQVVATASWFTFF